MQLNYPVARRAQLIAPLAFAMLLAIVAHALIQSGLAMAAGNQIQDAIPVLEQPIADFGKVIAAGLTAWMPESRFTTPFGDFFIKKAVAYTIYEWVKLPLILFFTTYGMTLLRIKIGVRAVEKTLGRNDFVGALGGTFAGMLTPVCSCTVTNLYAGLVAGGASRKASSAFLFASPALNEFAIIFMFIAAGPVGGLIYLALGSAASLLTAYLAPILGLNPDTFVNKGLLVASADPARHNGLMERAYDETLQLCRRLIVPVLLSGLLAGMLVNFNLSIIEVMQYAQFKWWGPIVATLIGLPLDINAASTAPILLGIRTIVPLGTLISVMMATTVSSIPEAVMLDRLIGLWSTAKVIGWYATYTILVGIIINLVFV